VESLPPYYVRRTSKGFTPATMGRHFDSALLRFAQDLRQGFWSFRVWSSPRSSKEPESAGGSDSAQRGSASRMGWCGKQSQWRRCQRAPGTSESGNAQAAKQVVNALKHIAFVELRGRSFGDVGTELELRGPDNQWRTTVASRAQHPVVRGLPRHSVVLDQA
jgi:hypothetical protein